ncbi:MAG: phage tail protein [Crocinitomicaceae bacterium]|jgi:microcystin-dependent protein|nr:phage tail protein [Crocinitomicaceae bacterium]
MDEYIGIVKAFAGNFAPLGWLMCDGSLLPISQYDTLYSLLGTTYGGDGIETFALPDLRSRVTVGASFSGPLGPVALGEVGGQESHTLNIPEMPAHTHVLMAANVNATDQNPVAGSSILAIPGTTASGSFVACSGYNSAAPNIALANSSVSPQGGSQAHENRQPYLAINYIICVEGIYPSPN